jgi:hypothetical protein
MATDLQDADPCVTLVRVYNRYLVDMVLSLKVLRPALKRALKQQHHSAIDPASAAHIECAARCLPRAALLQLDAAQALRDERVLAFEPLSGIPIKLALAESDNSGASSASIETDAALLRYVYTFAVLCATYSECREAPDKTTALASNVLRVLADAQAGGHIMGGPATTESDACAAHDGILDDDIVALLDKLGDVPPSPTDGEVDGRGEEGDDAGNKGFDDIMRSLEKSKIGDLAREITQELDMTKMTDSGGDPADMLNFDNINDSSTMLGSIVNKVGSKIKNKLQNGEINHQELLAEAMSLMSAFNSGGAGGAGGAGGGGNMFADLFKAASAASSASAKKGASSSSTSRERMRQRLLERQQQEQKEQNEKEKDTEQKQKQVDHSQSACAKVKVKK